MTVQQEQTRLAELVRLAPLLLGNSVLTLIDEAAALACDCAAAERNRPTAVCGSGVLAHVLFESAICTLADVIFRELIGTHLCADEPPDKRGAIALVQHRLTARAAAAAEMPATWTPSS
jgi:hypothetical protein